MKDKRSILIACTNYNTPDKLNSYIQSLEKAGSADGLNVDIEVLIADNSDEFMPVSLPTVNGAIKISHSFNKGNLGFLGGITNALKETGIDISSFDYFIISNVDVKVGTTFFLDLLKLEPGPEIGWIAPAIISEKEGRDRNPKILHRPSLRKMKITILFYRFPILHYLYENLIYMARKSRSSEVPAGGEIYAGHGSFMIFTRKFTERNKHFEFPTFLFGEEIFFAELMRKNKLITLYEPAIMIEDFDHASTGKLKKSDLYRMNFNSMKCLTKMFFLNE